jgi:hypothetical protein
MEEVPSSYLAINEVSFMIQNETWESSRVSKKKLEKATLKSLSGRVNYPHSLPPQKLLDLGMARITPPTALSPFFFFQSVKIEVTFYIRNTFNQMAFYTRCKVSVGFLTQN